MENHCLSMRCVRISSIAPSCVEPVDHSWVNLQTTPKAILIVDERCSLPSSCLEAGDVLKIISQVARSIRTVLKRLPLNRGNETVLEY